MHTKEDITLKQGTLFAELLVIKKGRLHRLDYLVLVMALNGAAKILDFIPEDPWWIFLPIGIPFVIISLYLSLSLLTKRLRDVGLSGWFALPLLFFAVTFFAGRGLEILPHLSGAGLIIVSAVCIALVFWPPQKKDTKYGAYDEFTLTMGFPKKKKEQKPEKTKG